MPRRPWLDDPQSVDLDTTTILPSAKLNELRREARLLADDEVTLDDATDLVDEAESHDALSRDPRPMGAPVAAMVFAGAFVAFVFLGAAFHRCTAGTVRQGHDMEISR